MKTLAEIYSGYAEGTDKGTTHSYIGVYEKLLAPYRHGCTIMELGLAVGDCLRMWQEYFSPDTRIIGVDTNDGFPKENFPGIEIITADCTGPQLLQELGNSSLDVVIDDASHTTHDQVLAFLRLRHCMNRNGIYIIEDIQNIDADQEIFKNLHIPFQIIDMRTERNRYDNVMVVYRF